MIPHVLADNEPDPNICQVCAWEVERVDCDQCSDGFVGHDCGEDCCACLEPEDNVACDTCDGYGFWVRCKCGHKSASEVA